MKKRTIKKWSVGIASVLLLLTIVSYIGIKSQIKHQNGGDTERVDPTQFKSVLSALAITNVSVLSTDCTKMIDSVTVLIKNGKILKVDKNIPIPTGYKIINGAGKYLVPGFADTHVHLDQSKNDLLLYLANGVTQIAEMFGNEEHLKWRKEAINGSLSPKIYVATRKIGSKKGLKQKVRSWFGSMVNYTSEKKACKAVQKFKKQGYDAIKLSSFLEPKIYNAIVDEAKKQHIPAIGHLTQKVRLNEFYISGQTQLAHIEEITKSTMVDFGGLHSYNTAEYLKYLKTHCDAIALKIKKNNIVVSSTIWIMESLPKQKFELENFIKNIELEYANSGIIEGSKMGKGWLPNYNSYENLDIKNNAIKRKKSQLFWKAYVEAIHIMTNALARNNVTIITGTDANAACTVPGFSLHDEFVSLHKSGLSKTQVLYATTVASSKWMKTNAGKIKIGYRADLVLLTKNPLEDIKNTQTINAVITNGKLLDRNTLDKMLQSIKEANTKSRKVSIDKFI